MYLVMLIKVNRKYILKQSFSTNFVTSGKSIFLKDEKGTINKDSR